MLSIKLSIEGTIPKIPIRKLHEISTSEALEITFSSGDISAVWRR
jgi:hypothetical protein